MLTRKSLTDFFRIRGFVEGTRYPWRGAIFLWRRKSLWPYLIVPFVLNIMLFCAITWTSVWALRHFVFTGLPHAWWAIIVKIFLASAAGSAILLFSIFCFAFVGSIIAAPFYDSIAERTLHWLGAPEIERGFWRQIIDAIRASVLKLGLFLGLQLILLALYFVPFFVGFFTYTTVGFLITAFFMALEFLDVSFHREGWTFRERLEWCKHRMGLVLGFGASVSVLLLLPIVNLIIPPIALIGAILLFSDEESLSVHSVKINGLI